MDKIEKIRQEIERLKGICIAQTKANPGQTFPFVMEMTGYDKLLAFLDTLSEEEPVPKGYDEAYLNEKIAKASKTWEGVDVDKYMDEVRGREPNKSLEEAADEFARLDSDDKCVWKDGGKYKGFIAGAKWQKEQDTRDMFMSDNRHFNKVYELGKKDMKEQMLKDAVEGEIQMRYSGCLCAKTIRAINEDKFKLGDKVRIIIVKEDKV